MNAKYSFNLRCNGSFWAKQSQISNLVYVHLPLIFTQIFFHIVVVVFTIWTPNLFLFNFLIFILWLLKDQSSKRKLIGLEFKDWVNYLWNLVHG